MNEQPDIKAGVDHVPAAPAPDTADVEPERPRSLRIEIIHASGDWSAIKSIDDLVLQVTTAIERHKFFPSGQFFQVNLALGDDHAIQNLNRLYRGRNKPTNVLSFPSTTTDRSFGPATTPEQPQPLGDIMLALETITKEAGEQGKLPAHHLQHLVVHGILHLFGFDHECDEDADEMEAIEIEILRTMAIANPYTDSSAVPTPCTSVGDDNTNTPNI